MQIQIINGIYRKPVPDLATAYPVNLMPVAEDSGVSKGYLRSARGVRKIADTEQDRGGYVWNGTHYRVLGSNLVTVAENGSTSIVGSVGSGGTVRFAQSFDRLAINSGTRLYYLKDGTLSQVTDPDLGPVYSLIWIDGYFMTTDGTSLVVTELNNPTSVDPLKYGSSEADPDPVVGLLSLRGEVYALNRNTIEVFNNTGSTGFPFARQRGAQIPKGCVGPHAFAPFIETFAFVGSGRNEQPGVFLAGAGQAIQISPKELDGELAALSELELASIELESLNDNGIRELLIHLPNRTWVYSWTASQKFDTPVWYCLAGGAEADEAYPARHHVFSGGKWWCGSDSAIGYVDDTITSQFGESPGYVFMTPMLYNAGKGALVHELELVTIGGTSSVGEEVPTIFCAASDDGITFSEERAASLGGSGDRRHRTAWRRMGRFRNWRVYRFRGIADAPRAFPRLEAQLEGLS
ncbi:hypothetical protein IC614_03060 [Allosphingosinicella flava]|uniref:Bacteriophage P22, Gp10, DNA-stabilising n=1 Tax=Allosphingosinicella flava TaxID=2771430 RepID=A0A7T2GKL8_9SPHN|nr:packaged DNA stabilization protein [Sphingosinicella flava]QPQ55596.1 hypothetical protein IC614_03060 [Sphingosinicella flava]